MHKYGREFSAAVMENRDGCVSERVSPSIYPIFDDLTEHSTFQIMKKLDTNMPSADLVEGYLTEIARGYGVRWTSDLKQLGDDQRGDAEGLAVGVLATVSHSLPVYLFANSY
jgi:vacuolar protein sorting-associated protein IST1